MTDEDFMLPQTEMSKKENQIATEYMLLPLIKRALEIDQKAVARSGLKFKDNYVAQLDEALHKVHVDMRKNKQDVFDCSMKLTKCSWFRYKVYVRGILFDVAYNKMIAMDWIEERVKEYLQ
ncbi:hypothetical protein [Sporolactobacillus terrae]|uniref:hypothetical protein n=1 Tax=Sporolactobacillus terrae TaxID=269673 RepID=UPI000491121E|nr:hypothetical protein [Sporolactobacillus terrae]